jgi:DNA-directed RNA polymerase specialized sigma24 family protein
VSGRDWPDFHTVRPEHLAIHDLLLNWTRVVRVNTAYAKPTPMFAHYRSSEVWACDTQIPADLLAGWKMEKAVGQLPPKHRDAVRWAYVHRRVPPQKQARMLAVPLLTLGDLVHDARSMLKNRA